jgi:hypothetical protein
MAMRCFLLVLLCKDLLCRAELCSDGRICEEIQEFSDPCIVFHCDVCFWDIKKCPNYDVLPPSDTCEVAMCTKPPPKPPNKMLTVFFIIGGVMACFCGIGLCAWKFCNCVHLTDWLQQVRSNNRQNPSNENNAEQDDNAASDTDGDSDEQHEEAANEEATSSESSPLRAMRTRLQTWLSFEAISNGISWLRPSQWFQNQSNNEERTPLLVRFRRSRQQESRLETAHIEMAEIATASNDENEDPLGLWSGGGIENENAIYRPNTTRHRSPPPPYNV